jgi:hypothetical protein
MYYTTKIVWLVIVMCYVLWLILKKNNKTDLFEDVYNVAWLLETINLNIYKIHSWYRMVVTSLNVTRFYLLNSFNKWRLTGNFENEIPESDSSTGNDYFWFCR